MGEFVNRSKVQLVTGKQSFMQLLARPKAGELDGNVLPGVLYQPACHVGYPHRLTYVQNKCLSRTGLLEAAEVPAPGVQRKNRTEGNLDDRDEKE